MNEQFPDPDNGGSVLPPAEGRKNYDVIAPSLRESEANSGTNLLEDTTSEGRPFLNIATGSTLGGYNNVIVTNGVITHVRHVGDEWHRYPDLRLGMELSLSGDSRGYIPSGHRPGDKVKIVAFAEPHIGSNSDRIVGVHGSGKIGWMKITNLVIPPIDIPLTTEPLLGHAVTNNWNNPGVLSALREFTDLGKQLGVNEKGPFHITYLDENGQQTPVSTDRAILRYPTGLSEDVIRNIRAAAHRVLTAMNR